MDTPTTVTVEQVTEAMQTVASVEANLIQQVDETRQVTEDRRSQRRNRNRVLMILVAWLASALVPVLAHAIHQPFLGQEAAAIGFSGDLIVTGWAWIKKY